MNYSTCSLVFKKIQSYWYNTNFSSLVKNNPKAMGLSMITLANEFKFKWVYWAFRNKLV